MGKKEDNNSSELKKPLASEVCSIKARERAKQAKKAGIPPLCESCSANKHTVCSATGHVICSPRKETGWVPIPFSPEECGLHTAK